MNPQFPIQGGGRGILPPFNPRSNFVDQQQKSSPLDWLNEQFYHPQVNPNVAQPNAACMPIFDESTHFQRLNSRDDYNNALLSAAMAEKSRLGLFDNPSSTALEALQTYGDNRVPGIPRSANSNLQVPVYPPGNLQAPAGIFTRDYQKATSTVSIGSQQMLRQQTSEDIYSTASKAQGAAPTSGIGASLLPGLENIASVDDEDEFLYGNVDALPNKNLDHSKTQSEVFHSDLHSSNWKSKDIKNDDDIIEIFSSSFKNDKNKTCSNSDKDKYNIETMGKKVLSNTDQYHMKNTNRDEINSARLFKRASSDIQSSSSLQEDPRDPESVPKERYLEMSGDQRILSISEKRFSRKSTTENSDNATTRIVRKKGTLPAKNDRYPIDGEITSSLSNEKLRSLPKSLIEKEIEKIDAELKGKRSIILRSDPRGRNLSSNYRMQERLRERFSRSPDHPPLSSRSPGHRSRSPGHRSISPGHRSRSPVHKYRSRSPGRRYRSRSPRRSSPNKRSSSKTREKYRISMKNKSPPSKFHDKSKSKKKKQRSSSSSSSSSSTSSSSSSSSQSKDKSRKTKYGKTNLEKSAAPVEGKKMGFEEKKDTEKNVDVSKDDQAISAMLRRMFEETGSDDGNMMFGLDSGKSRGIEFGQENVSTQSYQTQFPTIQSPYTFTQSLNAPQSHVPLQSNAFAPVHTRNARNIFQKPVSQTSSYSPVPSFSQATQDENKSITKIPTSFTDSEWEDQVKAFTSKDVKISSSADDSNSAVNRVNEKAAQRYKELALKRESFRRKAECLVSQLEEIDKIRKVIDDVVRQNRREGLKNVRSSIDDNLYRSASDLHRKGKKTLEKYRDELKDIKTKIYACKSKLLSSDFEKIEKEILINPEELNEKVATSEVYTCFDPGNHWCVTCRINVKNFQSYLDHLQDKHKDDFNMDKILQKNAIGNKKDALEKDAKLVCSKGLEFMQPITAFYCALCKETLLSKLAAEKHLKEHDHYIAYMSFTKFNSLYEEKFELATKVSKSSVAKEKEEKEKEAERAEREKEIEKKRESINAVREKLEQQKVRSEKEKYGEYLDNYDADSFNEDDNFKYKTHDSTKNEKRKESEVKHLGIKLSLKTEKKTTNTIQNPLTQSPTRQHQKVVYIGKHPNFKSRTGTKSVVESNALKTTSASNPQKNLNEKLRQKGDKRKFCTKDNEDNSGDKKKKYGCLSKLEMKKQELLTQLDKHLSKNESEKESGGSKSNKDPTITQALQNILHGKNTVQEKQDSLLQIKLPDKISSPVPMQISPEANDSPMQLKLLENAAPMTTHIRPPSIPTGPTLGYSNYPPSMMPYNAPPLHAFHNIPPPGMGMHHNYPPYGSVYPYNWNAPYGMTPPPPGMTPVYPHNSNLLNVPLNSNQQNMTVGPNNLNSKTIYGNVNVEPIIGFEQGKPVLPEAASSSTNEANIANVLPVKKDTQVLKSNNNIKHDSKNSSLTDTAEKRVEIVSKAVSHSLAAKPMNAEVAVDDKCISKKNNVEVLVLGDVSKEIKGSNVTKIPESNEIVKEIEMGMIQIDNTNVLKLPGVITMEDEEIIVVKDAQNNVGNTMAPEEELKNVKELDNNLKTPEMVHSSNYQENLNVLDKSVSIKDDKTCPLTDNELKPCEHFESVSNVNNEARESNKKDPSLLEKQVIGSNDGSDMLETVNILRESVATTISMSTDLAFKQSDVSLESGINLRDELEEVSLDTVSESHKDTSQIFLLNTLECANSNSPMEDRVVERDITNNEIVEMTQEMTRECKNLSDDSESLKNIVQQVYTAEVPAKSIILEADELTKSSSQQLHTLITEQVTIDVPNIEADNNKHGIFIASELATNLRIVEPTISMECSPPVSYSTQEEISDSNNQVSAFEEEVMITSENTTAVMVLSCNEPSVAISETPSNPTTQSIQLSQITRDVIDESSSSHSHDAPLQCIDESSHSIDASPQYIDEVASASSACNFTPSIPTEDNINSEMPLEDVEMKEISNVQPGEQTDLNISSDNFKATELSMQSLPAVSTEEILDSYTQDLTNEQEMLSTSDAIIGANSNERADVAMPQFSNDSITQIAPIFERTTDIAIGISSNVPPQYIAKTSPASGPSNLISSVPTKETLKSKIVPKKGKKKDAASIRAQLEMARMQLLSLQSMLNEAGSDDEDESTESTNESLPLQEISLFPESEKPSNAINRVDTVVQNVGNPEDQTLNRKMEFTGDKAEKQISDKRIENKADSCGLEENSVRDLKDDDDNRADTKTPEEILGNETECTNAKNDAETLADWYLAATEDASNEKTMNEDSNTDIEED